jgi:hypothetical protein
VQLGHGGRVAAAQAGQQRGVGQLVAVQGGIQLAPNPGSSAVAAPQQPLSQPQAAGWPQPQSPLVSLAAAA